MVSHVVLQCVDSVLRRIRENNTHFGGLKVLFAGDFLQIPCIIPNLPDGADPFEFACVHHPCWRDVQPFFLDEILRCSNYPEMPPWLFSIALGLNKRALSPISMPKGIMWTSNVDAARRWVATGDINKNSIYRVSDDLTTSVPVPPTNENLAPHMIGKASFRWPPLLAHQRPNLIVTSTNKVVKSHNQFFESAQSETVVSLQALHTFKEPPTASQPRHRAQHLMGGLSSQDVYDNCKGVRVYFI